MTDIRVVLLGTNGWYDTETGSTISILVSTDEYDIVLDAGLGFHRLDQYSDLKRPVYLFLSHYHFDHICGLHVLPKFGAIEKLVFMGQPGIEQTVRQLLCQPFTMPLDQHNFDIEFCELPQDKDQLPFGCAVGEVVHAAPTLGIRLEVGDKVITFVTDTGYCSPAVELSQGADLLFTECAARVGERTDDWPHLDPQAAARIASEAGAKQLVLIHFTAHNYDTIEKRKEAEQIAQRCFPNSMAGMDRMEIRL